MGAIVNFVQDETLDNIQVRNAINTKSSLRSQPEPINQFHLNIEFNSNIATKICPCVSQCTNFVFGMT